MKKIKLEGKLSLNKKTISKLNGNDMHEIKGGADASEGGCKTRLACKHTNTLSYGHWCTIVDGCAIDTIHTKGIFCQEPD